MKRRILPFILAGALTAAFAAPAAANNPQCEITQVQRGGAAALVSLVNANVLANVGVVACDINVLNNSLNNLLRNADIRALNNILNNSPILSNNDIDVTVERNNILNNVTVSVLGGPTLVFNFVD